MKISEEKGLQHVLVLADLVSRTGFKKSAICYKINPRHTRYDPSFPKPIKISPRRNGWLDSEVTAWIASRPRLQE